MKLSSDPFFDVPRRPFALSNGQSIDLPVLYIDCSNLGMWFLVDLEKAQSMLPEPYIAVPSEQGSAMAHVGLYEYRETSLGPYNEGATGILCVHPDNLEESGIMIIDLPVTTETARQTGVDVWGYPKFVCDIEMVFDGSKVESTLTDSDGKVIMKVNGDRGISIPAPASDLLTFAHSPHAEGKRPGFVEIRNPYHVSTGAEITLSVGDSTHRMANNLRALGLDGKSPDVVMYTNQFQSRLDLI